MKKFIMTVCLGFFLFSCSDNSTDNVDKNATKVDVESILSYPGFINFQITYDEYDPTTEMIDSIRSRYNIDSDEVYIYLRPDCRCTPSTKTFPELMKSLDLANIPREDINIYVMENETFSYPEKGMIEVTDLPQIFIKHNENIYDITTFEDTVRVEEVIYNTIK